MKERITRTKKIKRCLNVGKIQLKRRKNVAKKKKKILLAGIFTY